MLKLLFLKILNVAISAVGILIAARICGPSVYAKVFICISIASITLDLIDFGGASWASRELASYNISVSEYFSFCLNRFTILVLIPFASIPLFLLNRIPLYILILTIYPCLWLTTNYFQQFCFVQKFHTKLSIANLFERMCWLLVVPFINLKMSESTALASSIVLGLFVHCLFVLPIFYKLRLTDKVVLMRNVFSTYSKHYNYGLIGFISDFGALDVLIIKFLSGANSAGIYSVPMKLQNSFTIGYNLFITKLRPILSRVDRTTMISTIKSDIFIVVLNTILLLISSIYLPSILVRILGGEYRNSESVIRIACLVFIFAGFFDIVVGALLSLRLEYTAARLSIMNTILGLIFVGLGSFVNSAFGAIVGLLCSKLLCSLLGSISLVKSGIELFKKE